MYRHIKKKLSGSEKKEILEWYENSDYQALSQLVVKGKSGDHFKVMSNDEMLADLHKEVKSFLRIAENH